MPLLPPEMVRTYLAAEDEIPAALALAGRRRLDLRYDEEDVSLTLRLEGPAADPSGEPESYLVTASFDDYRVLPPAWRFVHPRTGSEVGPAAYPHPTGPSIFHPNGLICAHWNRLAYSEVGGPHGDWGGPANWQKPPPGTSVALTVSDMVDRIVREVAASAGRMGPLPQ